MRVDFDGACTIQRMEELLQTMRQTLAGADEPVTLGFSRVQEADLAFFQLLLATRKSFAGQGKELRFAPDLPPHLGVAARLSGCAELADQPA